MEPDDRDELLKELLGIASFDGEWIEEIAPEDDAKQFCRKALTETRSIPASSRVPIMGVDFRGTAINENSIFDYAYNSSDHSAGNGHVGRPHVQVVSLAGNRGNGLIASAAIPKGAVIFTERAAVAAQIPPPNIQACEYCFQSLEPFYKLSESLPRMDLWPIPPLDFSVPNIQDTQGVKTLVDKYGRVQCENCKSLFCTKYHYQTFLDEYGDCCSIARIMQCLPSALGNTNSAVQAPVALAARLFAHSTQYYRRRNSSLVGHFLNGICGSAEELDALDLGVLDEKGRCTLEPLYEQLVEALKLSVEEQSSLSLCYFHRVAAQAARNGFGMLTLSPFKTYYSALLRSSSGRDSLEHKANMRCIAECLGSKQLERGMDRMIESKVAPEICGLFPLTARCNHSCEPNAEVRSQEFVGHHIDVVAKRTLLKGEEVLISYIGNGTGVGKKSTLQRQRELQSKYLFHCDCSLCKLDH